LSRPPPLRFEGTDAARAFALLLMTCTHTLRVASPSSHSDLSSWLMRLEPVTPTLFALLAGAGLAASQLRRPSANWRAHHLLRALALVALSWLLFLPYHGPQWPESLVSTGILQCLGTGIALAALLGSPVVTGIAGVAALAGWSWMDFHGIRIDGLNQGSFPVFPYVPLLLLAHSWTALSEKREGLRSLVSVGAVLVVVAIGISPGFRNVWGDWGMTSTYQVYSMSANGGGAFGLMRDMAAGIPLSDRTMTFWHTRPQLVPLLVAMAALVIVFFRTATRHVPSDIRLLSRLGRHSLPYYLGHFVGLGALSLLPRDLRHGRWTWAVATLLMIALGIAYSTWRERLPKETSP
jgi:hypothetical protein